jgi:Cd2+/Zn2+-exporting ATPase
MTDTQRAAVASGALTPALAVEQAIDESAEQSAHGGEQRRIDFQIFAVLGGAMLLLAAVAALWLFDSRVHSDLLAMAASVMLGGPIIYGAVKGLITGRCSHDHGHAHGAACNDPAHPHAHDDDHELVGGSHMEELVAIAIIAAFASGEYLECAAIAFFMLIASLIEHRTAVGALQEIESLVRITPTRARLLVDPPEGADGQAASEREIPAAELRPGNRVVVLPGDNIPGDGVVETGTGSVDQATITGESLPVDKEPGSEVFAGTINQTGRMVVQITRAGEDSTLGRVQSLILQAAQSRPAVVRELSRYAAYYTPVVLMIAGLLWFFTRDLDKSIALLLVACPCAIILASPTAVVAALSAAARLGVLVKSVSDLEVVRNVTAFVFDKTGTLTTGDLAVTRMKPVEGVDGAELLRLCAAAEAGSRHPVARGVARTAAKARLNLPEAEHFQEAPGRGVRAVVDGREVLVGRESYLAEHDVDLSGLDREGSDGLSLLFVAADGRAIGWVGLADTVRDQAQAAVATLGEQGVRRLVMITGDRVGPAQRIAEQVGLTDVHAEALPGDKLTLVNDLKRAGHVVAVIGDGVNDGPALAAGHVSLAMGAAGSDVAVESASIALMNNNLDRLPFLVSLSKQTVAIIRQNLLGTMVYIVIMLALLAAGWLTPLGAAIGHGLSAIAVIFNSARLVRQGENLTHHADLVEPAEPTRRATPVALPPRAATA